MMDQYITAITIVNTSVATMLIAYVVWQLWNHHLAVSQCQFEASPTITASDTGALRQQTSEVNDRDEEGLAGAKDEDRAESDTTPVSAEFVATTEVLKLRVDDYLQHIVDIEQRARNGKEDPEDLLPDLCGFNQKWLEQLDEVVTSLMENLDGSNEIESALEEVVLNVTAQTETTCSNLSNHQPSEDDGSSRRFLLDEIYRLIRSAHELRDHTMETLFRCGGPLQVGSIAESAQEQDAYAQVVEVVEQCQQQTEKKLLSVAYLDVDRFNNVNLQHGTQCAESIADHLREVITELLQDASGVATVVRLGGARYIAVVEGLDYSDAVEAMEATRQNVEATTFTTDDGELTVTLSAVVVTARSDEPATLLLPRLRSSLSGVKPQGGNRVIQERAAKPSVVEPLKVFVQPQVISLDALYDDAVCHR